jgi:hypothetical protein
MNHITTKKLLSTLQIIILAVILAIGIQYVRAWTSSPGTPPTCPTGYAGCDAPINVGSLSQIKAGPLTVNASTTAQANIGFYSWGQSVFDNSAGLAPSAIRIIDGHQASGTVLTSDQYGDGTWQPVTSTGGSSLPACSTGNAVLMYNSSTHNYGCQPETAGFPDCSAISPAAYLVYNAGAWQCVMTNATQPVRIATAVLSRNNGLLFQEIFPTFSSQTTESVGYTTPDGIFALGSAAASSVTGAWQPGGSEIAGPACNTNAGWYPMGSTNAANTSSGDTVNTWFFSYSLNGNTYWGYGNADAYSGGNAEDLYVSCINTSL